MQSEPEVSRRNQKLENKKQISLFGCDLYHLNGWFLSYLVTKF
ncbi:conserved hypothetical protein [Vibrio cholerae O1 str. 2010EL-1786]|uniref:Uncharacterized protein n=4 Tax=Vibrio cholerae TaxID=666 RepID=Q9KN76_VIBCH|nr:hypothetical protein VC_A0089 [Vibrio cholerae O1 biovar El Tor str. N16961]ABQ18616.1 hypothetical protein VC0395_0051 [Vibrio cholerae O395]ACP07068.1 conserved hypothetical protein [Vibrio cholerae M66-2]AET29301.1 conserved hypothetical protein [Vibrio cholerae O1 str. 2010EL-1786]APF50386.1 hypothetical protein ASZ80_02890 [Vibrio cholerae]EAZ78080.1 hypothetical protein A5E_A0119 [Vibrio cholerae B33]EET24472.1 conserved hypothetical protein [Vibrio cholerae MO10]EMB00504.1 Hypothet